MPKGRLIEKDEVKKATRRRAGEHVAKQREEARAWLRKAKAGNKALELTLSPEERDDTIKNRYRIIAKDEGLKVRFHTGSERHYTNRKGVIQAEADVLIVVVQ